MIDKAKLDEIKNTLPQGALKAIEKKAKVSYQTVLNFFRGKSENVCVMEAVIEVYREHQKKVDKINGLNKAA